MHLKIPLEYDKTRSRVSITCSVRINGHSPVPVVFLVDTGSQYTFVDEFTTQKVRVFTDNLDPADTILLGGTKIDLYKVGTAEFNFHVGDNQLEKIVYNDLKVSKSGWTRKEAIYSPISLLGMDFLLNNKLTLFLQPDKEEGYIEDSS